MGVEGWPVQNGIAGSAVPADVSASAVTQAGDVPNEDLIRGDGMTVGAPLRPTGDPLAIRCPHQIPQHNAEPTAQV